MYQRFYRPFELLKLIRDKRITNIQKFQNSVIDSVVPPSYLFHKFYELERGLQSLGLIEITDEEVSSTDSLSVLIRSLDISLTQLANFSANSIVCSPVFGTPREPSVKSDIFVIMPFLKNLKPVYDDHIRNVSKELKLTVARGDDFFTAGSIISDIWNAINSCRIVVADCTGRNPNVFYEIGMAHTLGKPVILISQNKDDIPFDIQHIRYLVYEFTPRGMSEFENSLKSTLKSELSNEFSYEMFVEIKND